MKMIHYLYGPWCNLLKRNKIYKKNSLLIAVLFQSSVATCIIELNKDLTKCMYKMGLLYYYIYYYLSFFKNNQLKGQNMD